MTALWGCLMLVFVSASLHQRSEAFSQRDIDRVFLTCNLDSDSCKDITDSSTRDSKKTADEACQQAFFALDRIKQNTCQNWCDAGCRLISGQSYRQCSCLVFNYDGSYYIATPFRECAKNIASEAPSTRVEVAQTQKKRKHDDAQKLAKKRHVLISTELYGGVGASTGLYSSGGAGSSEDVPIGSGASSSASRWAEKGAPRSFPCPICPRIYQNFGILNTHMKSHNTNETTCPVCHQVFTLRYNLKTHIVRDHPGTPLPEKARRTLPGGAAEAGVPAIFPCPHCRKSYVHERTLKEHLKSHHTDETKCPVCHKLFGLRRNLKFHIEKEHPGTPLPKRARRTHPEGAAEAGVPALFPCPLCPDKFVFKGTLREHMKIHNADETKCPVCHQTFADWTNLKSHVEEAHPGTPLPERVQPKSKESGPFLCKHCGNEYVSKKIMREHERSHETLDTHCFECKITYARRGGYLRHLRNTHPEDALALEEAERERHIQENPEVCGICNKRFRNSDGLREHRKTHQGKTTCEFCGKVFTRVRVLNSHKLIDHPKEWTEKNVTSQ